MKTLLCSPLISIGIALSASAQESPADGKMLLTILLRHDQSMTLDQINEHLRTTGFRKSFPPEGVEIVAYYIVMGIEATIGKRETLLLVYRSITLAPVLFCRSLPIVGDP
jgi:hypothetical protein